MRPRWLLACALFSASACRDWDSVDPRLRDARAYDEAAEATASEAAVDARPDAPMDSSLPDPCVAGCRCADPSAQCRSIAGSVQCVRGDTSCAASGCPAGYQCQSDRCVCVDAPSCGRTCGDAGVCTCGSTCFTPMQRCFTGPPCSLDRHCPMGRLCYRGTCVQPGTRGAGQSCQGAADCASLLCEGGVCVTACRSSSECGAGRQCIISFVGMTTTTARCGPAVCPSTCAGNTLCSTFDIMGMTSGICLQTCLTSAECGAGMPPPACSFDALFSSRGTWSGTCPFAGSAGVCRGTEVQLIDAEYMAHGLTSGLTCSAQQACATSADCPAGYPLCVSSNGVGGLCARGQ